MPFPLAHPAAALPFRGLCPKYLNFAALIVGSLIPDLAACIDDWEYFSHTILGSFLFCLPVGLLTLWSFYRVRTPLVSTFPNPHRSILLPFCTSTPNSLVSIVISLLVGSWTHIIWDLFTHDHSWLVQHTLSPYSLAGLPLNRLLWLLSSVVGSALLLAAYLSLFQKGEARIWLVSPSERRAYVRWCSVLLIPLAGAIPLALHDARPSYSASSFVRSLAMYYQGCGYLTLLLIGFFLSRKIPCAKIAPIPPGLTGSHHD